MMKFLRRQQPRDWPTLRTTSYYQLSDITMTSSCAVYVALSLGRSKLEKLPGGLGIVPGNTVTKHKKTSRAFIFRLLYCQ